MKKKKKKKKKKPKYKNLILLNQIAEYSHYNNYIKKHIYLNYYSI